MGSATRGGWPGARWPATAAELARVQEELGAADPPAWAPPGSAGGAGALRVGGCFACFARGIAGAGAAGDLGAAGAAVTAGRAALASVAVLGQAAGPYLPALLALREGPLLEAAVRALPVAPEVLLVNATGRDHPRRAGLALHLGAVLGLPTVGVTNRPLVAEGGWPAGGPGARSPLVRSGEVVGYWVRTRAGAKPVAVHAAWRTDPEVAVAVVLAAARRARTPEPLRRARTAARRARTRAGG